ncbi:MAG: S-layer homology domain-containing protein [Clostridia bacterium]|nr:S-layer homology domain-containing protein [Clostridia bacterium]
MKQRILAMGAALVLCLGILAACIPAVLAYSDVTDSTVSEAVAVLAGMGVIDGYSDGTYRPNDALTRAQFCKLAVLLQNKGDQAANSAYRSLFSDVSSSHWAIGFINLAYSEGLVSGYGNGTFGAEDAVTAAQAVTVLLHVLGYSNGDIGPFWPEDYMSKAAKLGLTDGLGLSDNVPLTRGQAAVLLYRTLKSDAADGKEYLSSWASSTVKNAVLIAADAESEDGRVHTAQVYASGSVSWYDRAGTLSADLEGRRGTLLLNKSGKVSGFVPDDNSYQAVSLSKVAADGLTDGNGKTYTVSGNVTALADDTVGTYSAMWYDRENSSGAVLFYSESGNLDLVLFRDGGRYGGTLLTGYYENASPNTASPTKITILGITLDVADEAGSSLSTFAVGGKITVELDSSGKVKAAYDTSAKKADMIGVLTGLGGTTAKVELLSGLTASGAVSSSTTASALVSALVKVTASGVGKLSVSALSGSAATGKWDVAAGTVGKLTVSSDVTIYDQVKGLAATEVSKSDIPTDIVSADAITYLGINSSGQVDLIVLGDVTGNCYTYGLLTNGSQSGGSGDMTYTNYTLTVTNSGGTSQTYLSGSQSRGTYGGIAVTNAGTVTAIAALTRVSGVSRADFSGEDAVSAGGYVIPISDGVQVYNDQTDQWCTLAEAKAYSDTLSIYYDKTPATGGQVRIIVIE